MTYQNALALAVFTRSPSAYEALKSFKLLQLPSVRTLKYYIDANLEKAGDCMKRLEDERKHYLEMVGNKKAELDNKKLLRKSMYNAMRLSILHNEPCMISFTGNII